jgi:hypothetical protein
MYVDRDGEVKKSFASRSPPLGILPDSDFESTLDYFSWQESGALVVCSDGVTEANPDRQPFGLDGILQAMRKQVHWIFRAPSPRPSTSIWPGMKTTTTFRWWWCAAPEPAHSADSTPGSVLAAGSHQPNNAG